MAPTTCAKTTPSSAKTNQTHIRTPQSKQRLNFNTQKTPSNPTSAVHNPADHPVEVIGRIRDYPELKDKPISVLQVNSDGRSLRLRSEIGYRDFTLDGVSLSEDEGLDGFYKNFVQSRINGVKLGDKCTIMMYGPTGSGKSHTMFGCAKQQGIVYKSLKDILGNGDEEIGEQKAVVGTFVQVTVLEIYNEDIYDLLSTNTSSNGGFWSRGNASKVKLEVMGKKAKNATFISGTEAGKISKEIQKVEKRRIIKSTFCNERSSRSHCMIILDVPTVGGRLMLVDMAGSENIEQAGQIGFEAKMQTAKINQGNTALKRVVESIANGDSHVPFRDSKLTMLLQDSFEDDKSKILMILCASPDPKEIHKTISTLEYGAKAKCIVRGPHTPIKERGEDCTSADVILGSRIAAMDQFIHKLQMENKIKEKEKIEAHKQLIKKEEEIAVLSAKLAEATGMSEEEINIKVNERTNILRSELEKKIIECQKMADQVVEMERRKMEHKIYQQQKELEMLRRRLEEIESESRDKKEVQNVSSSILEGSSFAKKLMGRSADDEDPGMEKSMDLDRSLDMDVAKHDHKANNSSIQAILGYPFIENLKNEEYSHDICVPNSTSKAFLSTVFEEDEEEKEEEDAEKVADEEEVQKEVIEEKTMYSVKNPISTLNFDIDSLAPPSSDAECDGQDTASSRHLRIRNIFTLCGNYRQLSLHTTATSLPTTKKSTNGEDSPENKSLTQISFDSKENCSPLSTRNKKSAAVDPIGAPVAKEEQSMLASNLPSTCNNSQQHVACLRPKKKDDSNHLIPLENNLPFSSLENKLASLSCIV